MYRQSYELMEQIKLFVDPTERYLEEKVNNFIRDLDRCIEIKDISYSHYVRRDLVRWTAMVRYDDPDLDTYSPEEN